MTTVDSSYPSKYTHHNDDDDDGGDHENNNDDLCRLRMKARLEASRNRPTVKAARDFLANTTTTTTKTTMDWQSLPHRVRQLCHVLESWKPESAAGSTEQLSFVFSKDPQEARRIAMEAAIIALADHSFLPSFQSLFLALLDYHCSLQQNYETEQEQEEDNPDPDPILEQIYQNQSVLFRDLRTLGWLGYKKHHHHHAGSLLLTPFKQAIQQTIQKKIESVLRGDFETTGLYDVVQQWQQTTIAPWLQTVLELEEPSSSTTSSSSSSLLSSSWKQTLSMATAVSYCRTRMKEIFEMVADYPDSHQAILELQRVLEITKMYSELGQVLRQSLIRRLNHPGANTSQIIDVYIATIKVLRLIDPSDRLLSLVAEPVRTYLRSRSDTVRCIITSLTDAEAGGDLYDELRRHDAKPLENVTVDSDDEEEPPDFNWQPPPSIFKPRGTFLEGSTNAGDGDILAMLVSIYGSKELFVNEYRLMLADKLLASEDYNTDKEVHTLELLKLRFGEMSMRNCEVMIKDMDDSKRTNANIKSTLMSRPLAPLKQDGETAVDVVMVSHIFWPTLQNEQFKHHPRVSTALNEFSSEYARLKNPRKLVWFDQLGTVELELDVVENGEIETKEFKCSPLHATLIMFFEDSPTWTSEDLSNETGISEHVLQKRMVYWINHHVIQIMPLQSSNSTTYELASHAHLRGRSAESKASALMMMMDEEGETRAVSMTAQVEEEMEVYESYIMGMLTNLKQLPLEKINNMLKMFVTGSDIKYNKTPQQLSAFLQRLCKQEKLECGPDGMYRLFKK